MQGVGSGPEQAGPEGGQGPRVCSPPPWDMVTGQAYLGTLGAQVGSERGGCGDPSVQKGVTNRPGDGASAKGCETPHEKMGRGGVSPRATASLLVGVVTLWVLARPGPGWALLSLHPEFRLLGSPPSDDGRASLCKHWVLSRPC